MQQHSSKNLASELITADFQRSHRLNAVCLQLRVKRSVLKSYEQREVEKIVLYVRLLAPAQTLFAPVLGRSWSEQGLRSKRQ